MLAVKKRLDQPRYMKQIWVVAVLAMLALAPGATYAQQQGPQSIAGREPAISGHYADSKIAVDLPQGWSGINYFGSIVVSPDGVAGDAEVRDHWPDVSMVLMVMNRSDIEKAISNSSGASTGCKTVSTSYTQVGSMNALATVKECTTDGTYTKSKVYMAPSAEKVAVMAFTAGSQGGYDRYLPAFEGSAATVKFGYGSVDVSAFVAKSLGLARSVHPITVAGKQVDVAVDSSSAISNFGFDEGGRQISFTAAGNEKTRGIAIMQVGNALREPYAVTIDGVPSHNFTVIEDQAGAQRVRVEYSHSTHDIAVAGAAVVPEFPVHVAVALAGMTGAAMLATRLRPYFVA
jgi:hypothetical protein